MKEGIPNNDEHDDEHNDDDYVVVVVEDDDDVVVAEDEHDDDVDDDFCVNDKHNYYLVVSQKGFIQRINCSFRIYCIVISYFEQTALTEL